MGNRKLKQTVCIVKAYYFAMSYLDIGNRSLGLYSSVPSANYNENSYMRIHINAIDVIAITQLDENLYILELDSPYIIYARIELAIKYIIVSNDGVRKIKERLEQYYVR